MREPIITNEKPTLGIIPRYLWDEGRLNDIEKAIEGKAQSFELIPAEWITEYNELCEKRDKSRISRQTFHAPISPTELYAIILHDTSPRGTIERKDHYDVVSCESGKILFSGTGEDCKKEYPNYIRS